MEQSNTSQERIMEIEEGLKPAFIQTIRDADEIQRIGFDLVTSSKEDILILFSTPNSFRRQQKAGLIQLLRDVASQTDVKIRIVLFTLDLLVNKQPTDLAKILAIDESMTKIISDATKMHMKSTIFK